MGIRRDPSEAWERICETFPLDKRFTMREALEVGFPDLSRNNYSYYAKKMRALFLEVEKRTAAEYGVPHIRCVRRLGGSPSIEVWELPSSSAMA